MPVDHAGVGQWGPEHVYEVTAEAIEAYADAVNDANPAYRGASPVAPPVFGVVPGWEPFEACIREALSLDLLPRILHLVQDMRFTRAIRSGDVLTSRAQLAGVVGGPRATTLVAHITTVDGSREPVTEFYASIYLAGHGGEPTTGGTAPETRVSHDKADPVAVAEYKTGPDQAVRYAAASGDHNPIHTDAELARSVGHPEPILHGMCTLAFASRAVVDEVCAGDPSRLRRLAGRFSKPVIPGQTLATTLWPAGSDVFALETRSDAGPVVKYGRAEVS